MATFLIGIAILIVGGALYGRLCEKVFRPDDRQTPAFSKQDGVDYVPMPKWKNSLINLLNIAGTGPILGPIQGILFGPIAFITIPIGCVIGGAMHDYFSGIKNADFDKAVADGLIEYIGKKVCESYYSDLMTCRVNPEIPLRKNNISVVYTPLNGCTDHVIAHALIT